MRLHRLCFKRTHVPAIPIMYARPCPYKRDGRNKSGHDKVESHPSDSAPGDGVATSRLLHGGHRHAGDPHLESAQARAGAEIDGLPVVAREGDVGRVLIAMHDAAELLALRIEDINPAGAAAEYIAGGVDLHAVRR